jgi:iron complex transport system substrate-binding protein
MKSTLKPITFLGLAVVLLAAILTGCTCGATTPEETTPATTEPTTPTTPASVTVTDQEGREVTVAAAPARIVSLAPSNTEIIYAMGIEDRLVGRTDYCNYPPEVAEVPSIGGFSTPDLETVVALEPDLVLATSMHEEIVGQLEALGIATVVLAPQTIDEILASIELVGLAAGAEDEAAALVDEMSARIEAVAALTEGLAPEEMVRTCFVVWHDPLMLAGGDTLYEELIRVAGGSNIISDQSDYPSIDLEEVIVADPQVIIVGVGMGTGEDLPLQFLLDEPVLAVVSARQNDRVYAIDQDIVGRFGPRIVDALEQFASFLHPELFGAPD